MAPAPKPYLKFTHSKALRARTLRILDAIDTDADPTPHREELGRLITDLTDAGMQFFFLGPLNQLKMGYLIERAGGLGIASVLSILDPTVRKVVGRMDKKQLRQVSRIIRQMME